VRQETAVEICDRFWPYEKTATSQAEQDPASYVEHVRQMMGAQGLRPSQFQRGRWTAGTELPCLDLCSAGWVALSRDKAGLW
jgi:hypothetical protein